MAEASQAKFITNLEIKERLLYYNCLLMDKFQVQALEGFEKFFMIIDSTNHSP